MLSKRIVTMKKKGNKSMDDYFKNIKNTMDHLKGINFFIALKLITLLAFNYFLN
jgi:hypothetical protein